FYGRGGSLWDFRRLPRHDLPAVVAADESTRVAIGIRFDFRAGRVFRFGARDQAEGHDGGVAEIVNGDVFGGVGGGFVGSGLHAANIFHDVGLVADESIRAGVNHIVGEEAVETRTV